MQDTYIDKTSLVAGEEELSLQPLIANSLVECTRHDAVVARLTHGLIKQKGSVQSVQRNATSPTDHYISCHIIDPSALRCVSHCKPRVCVIKIYLHRSVCRKLSHKTLPVQVPEHDLAIRRRGEEGTK